MKKLFRLINEAQHSVFAKWLLNKILLRQIPFNAPHGVVISGLYDDGLRTRMPYTRKNQNHLKGMHACALATLGEFTAGIALLKALSSEEYRLIMKELRVEYHKQAREEVFAECRLTNAWVNEQVTGPLSSAESIFVPLSIEVRNFSGEGICTVHVNWQIKKWSAVAKRG